MNQFAHFQQQQNYDHLFQSQSFQNETARYYYSSSYQEYFVQTQQQQEQEPNPPGVTPPAPPQQPQNPYYQYPLHGAVAAVPNVGPPPGGVDAGAAVVHQTILPSPYGGTPIVDGGPPQGGVHSHFAPRANVPNRPFRGRGRGKGRGPAKPTQAQTIFTQAPANIIGGPSIPLPQSSFGPTPMPFQGQAPSTHIRTNPRCELCGVDCNTLEILEQHKNGKKHKKKLKSFEELQKLKNGTSQLSSGVASLPGAPTDKPTEGEILPSPAVNKEIETVGEKRKAEEVESAEEPMKKVRMDNSGRGAKHKMRGGKGGRGMGSSNRSKKPVVETAKQPKQVIPLICELCNVKCESSVVFQSHLVGKKHRSKAKRLLGDQEILGQEIMKSLSPAIQAFLQQNTVASTSIGPQTHCQVNGTISYADNTISEAVSQPPLVSVNFLGQNFEGKSNEGYLQSGVNMNNPAGNLLTAQMEGFGTTMAGASMFDQSLVGQPYPQVVLSRPETTVGQIQGGETAQ